jgi:hypothetical protein
MRTCDPDATSEAARCLDVIIDEFLMLLFDGRRFLNDMNGEEKEMLYKRVHLQFSKGGMGILPSEAITGAAFIGSLTLSFKYMSSLIPDLKNRWHEGGSRVYHLFCEHLRMGKDLCPSLAEITLENMVNKAFPQVQKVITNAIQKQIEEDVDRSVGQGRAVGGERCYMRTCNHGSRSYQFNTWQTRSHLITHF